MPGRGRSRNVIGVYDTPRSCLRIVMAHTDTAAGAPGANDNASGLGVVASLADRLRLIRPHCDVWLVATGAEERVYTGSPDHLGALALARRARSHGARRRLQWALSLDEVGRDRPVLAPLPGERHAAEGRGSPARRGRQRGRSGQLGARREHWQLRPPRVPAARPARRQARRWRGRRALPPHGVRPPLTPRPQVARARPADDRRRPPRALATTATRSSARSAARAPAPARCARGTCPAAPRTRR